MDDVDPVACPCGQAHRIITSQDTADVGLHVTDLGGARSHYHRKTTEVYYIMEGVGEMELGDQVYAVRPGHAILIPPGVPHRAIGQFRAVIATVPAFDPDDEHMCA